MERVEVRDPVDAEHYGFAVHRHGAGKLRMRRAATTLDAGGLALNVPSRNAALRDARRVCQRARAGGSGQPSLENLFGQKFIIM